MNIASRSSDRGSREAALTRPSERRTTRSAIRDPRSEQQSAIRNPQSALGFLGGSFDPPHAGHLALARAARDTLHLAEVRFMPAAQPWQKPQITDAALRAHMVELAIRGEPAFVLDMHEIERGGASYTADTLRALRRSLGGDVPLVWIIGSDQMQRLDTWHDWETLLDLAHLAVARRNHSVLQLNDRLQTLYNAHWAKPAAALARPHGHVIEIDMPPVDVSATALRQTLARDPSALTSDERLMLARALEPAVLDYIRAHHLYR
jgi:nicotinate-nucleotide adenylyltransferase